MRGHPGHNMTACPIAIQFPGNGCMDDLTNERSFESQATWVIAIFCFMFWICYPWVFVQLGTGRHPVDWCRNLISALYVDTSNIWISTMRIPDPINQIIHTCHKDCIRWTKCERAIFFFTTVFFGRVNKTLFFPDHSRRRVNKTFFFSDHFWVRCERERENRKTFFYTTVFWGG